MKGTYILTSDGLTNQKLIDEVVKGAGSSLEKKGVVIVTTASKNKELNPYSQKAYNQFVVMGFGKVVFADFETEPEFDFNSFNIIYVCGGNTFKLLHSARLVHFKKVIEDLLERDGVYIGVSAGTNIVTPSIHFVEEYNLDPNTIGMTDFDGFNLVPINIFVHYEPKWESIVGGYERKYNTSFERITNDQAIVIDDSGTRIISG
jgi:dipeptidase E